MPEVEKDKIDVLIKFYLQQGKRSVHPDFQVLFNLFGRDKIIAIAKSILKEEKESDVK